MLAVTSTAILAATVVAGIFIVGGVFHILLRTGRDSQRLDQLERDVRAIRDDVRALFRSQTGHVPPSERK
jgi:uncharacterized ion transporter superfamily protein YfcC